MLSSLRDQKFPDFLRVFRDLNLHAAGVYKSLESHLFFIAKMRGEPIFRRTSSVEVNFVGFVDLEPIAIYCQFRVSKVLVNIRLNKIYMGNLTDQNYSLIVFVLP